MIRRSCLDPPPEHHSKHAESQEQDSESPETPKKQPNDFTNMQPDVSRGPKYSPVALPRAESALYFSVWIGHVVYAIYLVYRVSVEYKTQIWGGYFEPGWSILGHIRQDTSNYEWAIWKGQIARLLPWLFAQSLISAASTHFLRTTKREYWIKIIETVFSLLAHFWAFGVVVTLLGIVCGGIILAISGFTKSKTAIWITAVSLLYLMARFFQEIFVDFAEPNRIYEYEVITAYKLLQFISAGSYFLKTDKSAEGFFRFYCSMIHYAFYLPYTVALIVGYEEFQSQYGLRFSKSGVQKSGLISICCLASRVIVYCATYELVNHFLYYNAIFEELTLLEKLTLPELCAVAFLCGQFFQVKYFAMFGVPSIFAKMDGMQPPFGPPICISRVALYSKMWRYFDRGLYAFIRDMIFVPVAGPFFGYPKRFLATVLSFAFVWIWHSPNYHYGVWIAMNFVEINLENVGKAVWGNTRCRTFLKHHLSATNLRRLSALSQIPCVALGIFAIFYFLGNAAGWILIKRVLIDQVLSGTLGGIWLLALGYCFCNVCIDLQMMIGY